MRRTEWIKEHESYATITRDGDDPNRYHIEWDGQAIGTVWKGTRTYSPPTHRGSRVAKYHKEVACWYYATPDQDRYYLDTKTRREAIVRLIDDHKRK